MEWHTTSTVLEQLGASNASPVWNAVLARFRDPIVHFARQLGLPSQDAEDVSQETLLAFLIGYRGNCYDQSKGRLSNWLFGIATRQILNARRRLAFHGARIKPGYRTSFWSSVPDSPASTALWAREWERALLQTYLDRVRLEVTPVTFQAFEIVLRAGRTPAEAASQLGVSVKAVYNAKHRVLKRIRQLRAEYEGTIFE